MFLFFKENGPTQMSLLSAGYWTGGAQLNVTEQGGR